jgi:DNA-binding transcriptional ArsR family regulator
MKDGPNIALLGSLIGDPARTNILLALMSGKALTASELALEANITAQTASAHLAKLVQAKLLHLHKQGRHRYFALADDDVGHLLETMMGLAAKLGHSRTRTGPKDPAMRKARVCYNHLAGEYGVHMLNSMKAQGYLSATDEHIELTRAGELFLQDLGLDVNALAQNRRPICKPCLDWSARRPHLAGTLGTALLDYFYENKWARREEASRVVVFLPFGEKIFFETFPHQERKG